ncbi:phytochrome-like protein cph1 [Abditibacteriota bacterium]|nr:phytochrome-like protein cph1 [Abditibacteriota bacterium]
MPQTSASLNNLSRNLVRYFSAMLLALLVLLSFALWNFHRLGEADGWKAHTYQLLLESQLLEESLFFMDNGVRGYIVSGKPSELTAFEDGKRTFREHLKELQRLAADNPEQLRRLQEASQQKDIYLQVVTPIIATRLPSDSLQQAVLKTSGSALARRKALEDVRSILGVFSDTEKALLAGRIEAQDRWRTLTEATLWIGSVFSVLLTLFLSTVSVRAVRESGSAYARLRESNFQLESSNSQLKMTKEGLESEVGQRRAAEEKLQRAVAELKRSNAELEQFAYVASHDLQEPLRAVAGCVQVLKRRYEGKLDERADQFIGHAVDGAQRMQNLIQDLLAYSRVGTKGKPFADVALDSVVDGVMQSLSTAIDESKAQIERVPLPSICGDAGQLGQVFQNLISNAIKFRGEAPPHIKIGCLPWDDSTHGKGWTISVSDRGPGIEPQYFERIFVMFQRLHTRAEYPGTGIGLAIVKKIIERHGGRIWVESLVGQGTTFSFYLPESPPDLQERMSDDTQSVVESEINVEKAERSVAHVGS